MTFDRMANDRATTAAMPAGGADEAAGFISDRSAPPRAAKAGPAGASPIEAGVSPAPKLKGEELKYAVLMRPAERHTDLAREYGVTIGRIAHLRRTYGKRYGSGIRTRVRVSTEAYVGLLQAATKRGIKFEALASRVLAACAADPHLIDNILDDLN